MPTLHADRSAHLCLRWSCLSSDGVCLLVMCLATQHATFNGGPAYSAHKHHAYEPACCAKVLLQLSSRSSMYLLVGIIRKSIYVSSQDQDGICAGTIKYLRDGCMRYDNVCCSQWTTLRTSGKPLLGTKACRALSGSCPLSASSDSTMSKWYATHLSMMLKPVCNAETPVQSSASNFHLPVKQFVVVLTSLRRTVGGHSEIVGSSWDEHV